MPSVYIISNNENRMSVPWGDGCSRGMSVPWGDGCSRGVGVPGGWVFQGDGSSRGMGVPGGWVFQGDKISGGWVSRGMAIPDTTHITGPYTTPHLCLAPGPRGAEGRRGAGGGGRRKSWIRLVYMVQHCYSY